MHDPPFESLSVRREQAGLSDFDVAELLGISESTLRSWSSPGPHDLSRHETERIIQLSVFLGRLMTILEPEAVRDWIFSPNPAYEGRTPANMIVTGDMKRVNDFMASIYSLPY